MPTIELCAVGQKKPIAFASDVLEVEVETLPVSHRALFAEDLSKLLGCIYHIGFKGARNRGSFFAGPLLEESHLDEAGVLEFTSAARAAMSALMRSVFDAPDTDTVLFLSDYQFGPQPPIRASFRSEAEFWNAHDSGQLRLNVLYSIARSG